MRLHARPYHSPLGGYTGLTALREMQGSAGVLTPKRQWSAVLLHQLSPLTLPPTLLQTRMLPLLLLLLLLQSLPLPPPTLYF